MCHSIQKKSPFASVEVAHHLLDFHHHQVEDSVVRGALHINIM
jgi:hypothetical protein